MVSGTQSPNICINTVITNIVFTVGGSATGASLTSGSFPPGVTGSFSGGQFTITGTPTISGTFPYTITTIGPCVTPSISGIITVTADATIALSSAPGTDAQTKCINTAITTITYLVGGGGTGATVSGLPSGVSGSYNAGTKVYTISGTPSVLGTFNYLVTTTGPCIKPALGGSIIVTPDATIALTSSGSTTSQTVCKNYPLVNITYSIGGSGTGATVSGLPAGVTGTYNAGVFTISGSPSATGSFSYTVITTGPCVIPTAAGTIDVNAIPTGTFAATETSGNTPNDNIICTGSTVTFTAPAGYASYIFKINGTTVQSGTGNVYNSSSLTNGASVTVDIANSLSCAATFGPIVITVNPLPVPTLAATETSGLFNNDNIICAGATVTFTASGGTSYNFKVNGSSVQSSAINTYSTNALANGNVATVDVTNANGCIATSSPITISVNPLPSGSLTATENSGIASNDNTICVGSNITFNAPPGYSNYDFKINGLLVQGSSSVSSYSTTSLVAPSAIATVTITNSNNCVVTLPALVINVNPLPTGTLSAAENSGTPNDNSICTGTPVTFTATAGFSTYTFKVGATNKQTGASNTYNTSGLNNGDVVTVIVADANQCAVTFNAITITVVATPAGTLVATENSGIPNDNAICTGSSVLFTATAGFANYNFKVNGVQVQNGPSNTYSTTTLINGQLVTVDVANASTCSTAFNGVTITVYALPAGTLSITENSGLVNDDAIICTGANASFTATAGFTNYNFLVNGVSQQSSASNIYNNSALTNGAAVTVEVTNANGCKFIFNSITVTVNTLPVSTFVATENSGTPNNYVICAGSNVTFTAATGFSNYDFKVNGVTAQSGTVNIFNTTTLTNGASITVQITNSNGCSATFGPIVITVNALPAGTLLAGETSGNVSNDNVICTGATVTFTATIGFANYIFKVNGVSVQNSPSRVYTTSSLANGESVTVDVKNASNCVSTFGPIVITVNPYDVLPAITGTLSVCVNSNTTLSNATTGGTWSSNNTAVATINVASGIATGKSAGTADITYTYTNGNGCVSTTTSTLTVNALPVPTLDGPNPICVNSTGNVYITEPGQFNYTWIVTNGTVTGGGTTSDNTVTVSWLGAGAKNISVNYTDANGCTGAVSATVVNAPSPLVPVITGPAVVCETYTGNLYSTQTGAGQTDYVWNVSGGTITLGGSATDNTATITWNTPGARSVSVIFSDVNGCSVASPTIYPVTVNPLPTASVSGTASACKNAPKPKITFTGAGGTAPYTFSYNINGGATQTIVSVGNTAQILVSTGSAGTLAYNLVSVSDASPTNCSQLQTGIATITINPLPTASTTGSTTLCKNDPSPNITFTGVAGTAPFTFTYTINGGPNQTINTTVGSSVNVAVPTGAAGTFVYNLVNVADANGCSQNPSLSETVIVNPLPTATISGSTTVCIGTASPNITFTGAAGTAPYTFTYNINGGANQTVTTSVGNSVTVAAATGTVGVFNYNLVSVKDGTTTSCTQLQTGTATVRVNPYPTATISGTASVCVGGTSPNVVFTGAVGTAPYTFTYKINSGSNLTVTTISGNSVNVPASTGTAGVFTYTLISVQDASASACSQLQSGSAPITVNPLPTAVIAGTTSVCQNASAPNITFTGASGTAPYTFTYKINLGPNLNVTSVGTTATVAVPTGTAGTYSYSLVSVQDNSSTTCSQNQGGSAVITVNPLPTATIAGTIGVCKNATAPNITFTGGNGTAPYTFTYKINAGGNLTVISAGNVATVGAPTSIVGTFTYTLISVKDATSTNCSQNIGTTATVTVNAPTVFPAITASPTTICLGNSSNLVIASGAAPVLMSENFEGTSTFSIASTGTNTNNAITTWINRTSTYVYNSTNFSSGSKFMLSNSDAGGNGSITNIALVSPVVSTMGNSALTLSYRTYFRRNGGDVATVEVSTNNGAAWTGVQTLTSTTGSATNFSTQTLNLTSYINNASFMIRFRYSATFAWYWAVDDVVLTGSSPVNNFSWTASPAATAGLPAGAVTSSSANANIVVTPTVAGSTIYTASLTNAAGCTSTANVTVTVNPVPVITITADYCIVPGKVRLTASSVPSATSYSWYPTGLTTPVIDIDIADVYQVTVTLASGCTAVQSISVAQELVVNGDFTNGNPGFTSDYAYQMDQPGLVPPGQGELYDDSGNKGYSISTDGQNVHIAFYGLDHTNNTTGPRNYMLVNGHGNTLVVWKETVNVLPNTTYYFSAWAMSLNSAGNNAQLQFSVNGTLTGTTAVLANHGQTTSSPDTWTRFYGTWTSGPTTTTADIYINDLQSALGGNDFGLDDISFGTLSTFVTLVSAAGTDAQTPCINVPITPIVYDIGSGNAPLVTALPAGLSFAFNGVTLTISGTPTVAGNFAYTVTTTGTCNPSSASGTVKVNAQAITLTSGSSLQTVCSAAPISSIVYTISGTATGASVSGLPAGISGGLTGNQFTISGSSNVAGTYNYTITTSGTCAPSTATGKIVIDAQTISLTSGNTGQSICINNLLLNIVYQTGGTATGGNVTGLPSGVTGTYTGGLIVISGTPTQVGTFNYSANTTGTCVAASLPGTITVNPAAAISLTSGAGSNNRVSCINNAIAAITFLISGGGTGATVSGLPAGINGNYSGGIFTISGSSGVAGVYNYTVNTTGTCAQTSATGSITLQTQTITLTSGSTNQTLCISSPISNIVYTLGGTATGAGITGLPPGVTATLSGNVYTISGTPTSSGPFSYTINTTGTCTAATASGAFTVQSQTITTNSGVPTQTICMSTAIVPIVFAVGGGATGASITSGGLPAGMTGAFSGGLFTISGTPTAPGVFNYTVTTSGSSCPPVNTSGTITVASQTIALTSANNIQTFCIGSPLFNIVYAIGGVATGATVTGLPAGVTVVYNAGTFTISGTPSQAGTFNYQVTTFGSSCTVVSATGILTSGSNVWSGSISTDWSNPNNWSCGAVPLAITNVIIPTAAVRMPQLTATSVSKTIQLQAGTTLDLNGMNFTSFGGITGTGLIKGSITSKLTVDVVSTASTINFDQSVPGISNALESLTIKGSANASAISNKLALYGVLDVQNGTLSLSDVLVLRSTSTSTARVAAVTGAIAYGASGKVEVERYYPALRAWRLITAPLSNTGNIYNSWQNGGVYTPAIGILVTGVNPTGSAGNGLDPSLQNNYSMKMDSNLAPVVNTKVQNLSNNTLSTANIGYFVFVRGDRNPNNTFIPNTNATTLSSKGYLQTGTQKFTVSSTMGAFTLVGNPYASPVDFSKLTRSNVTNRFYVWDPRLNVVGGYVTVDDFFNTGTYSYSVIGPGGQDSLIQSSQAFFVETASSGTAFIQFDEINKTGKNNLAIFRPATGSPAYQALRINLYIPGPVGSTFGDGTLVQFSDQCNAAVDKQDALKFNNINETVSLLRNGTSLSIERRPLITDTDTLFLRLFRTTQRSYKWEFAPMNLDPALTAFLEDKYTGISAPLNLTGNSMFDFVINSDPASAATDRFRIVFKKAIVLSVTFKDLKAYQQGADVVVEWKVENEKNISRYELEKSTDGLNFIKVNATKAGNAANGMAAYNWIDLSPAEGNNYYRIRSININGSSEITPVVVVKMPKLIAALRVYPNPIIQSTIGIEFKNIAVGIYETRLLNSVGQTILMQKINHAGGTLLEKIHPVKKLLAGIYQLEITGPDKTVNSFKVVVE